MMKYKICVYAISKNEEKFVDRWMDAVKEADMVIVTDTGSDDRTVERLREAGAIVYEEEIKPWRFDVARNIAMDHIPEDVDICVPNDLDEVFEAGWRKKLEDAWDGDCTRARYLFTNDYNSDGTPAKQFMMEKIHTRKNFRWEHPVHEILTYKGSDPEKIVWVNDMVLNHYPDRDKPRTQYLPLLELSVKENPQDDRAMFWLGREYLFYGKFDLCIETLKNHLQLPSALWNEERSASMRFIGMAYDMKGNYNEARIWLFKAIAECPGIREPYLKLAELAYLKGDWELVYAMVKKGLEIGINSGSYLVEQRCWGYLFYDLGATSAYHLGLYEEAHKYAIKALEMDKENEQLKKNLHLIENKIGGEEH